MNGRHDRNPRECEIRHHPPKPPSEVSRWREITDDGVVAERLGAQRPYWRAGTAFGNHALVMVAALSGEVVVRATGRTIQEHFAERIRDASKAMFTSPCPRTRNPGS
jgi:hypothetical protein